MSLPQRLSAYTDCVEIFDSAPIRVEFSNYAEANLFKMRMHQARALICNRSKQLYKPDDPRWGQTEYDHFIVRKPCEDDAGHWWVYIEPTSSNILSREPLDAETESTDVA